MNFKQKKITTIRQGSATKAMWIDEWLWRIARMRELLARKKK